MPAKNFEERVLQNKKLLLVLSVKRKEVKKIENCAVAEIKKKSFFTLTVFQQKYMVRIWIKHVTFALWLSEIIEDKPKSAPENDVVE